MRRGWSRAAACVALAALASSAACNAIFGIQNLSDGTADGGSRTEAGASDAALADGATPPANDAQADATELPNDAGLLPTDASLDAADAADAPDTAPPPPLVCDGGCAAGTVCAFGSCIAGNCETTADCAGAEMVCINNQCSPCSQDYQCAQGYPGAGFTCLDQLCTTAPSCNIQGRTCAPDHVCCLPSNTTSKLECLAGECCSVGGSDPSCVNNHTITTGCPLVASDGGTLAYYVSPDAGVDLGATGAPSCPFQTITHALAFIGTPSQPSVINVLGGGPTLPEAIPIAIPQNVTIAGAIAAPINLTNAPPPDGGAASPYTIVLSHPASGIEGFSYQGSLAAVDGVDRSTVVRYMAASDEVGNTLYVAASTPSGGLTIGPGFNGNFATLKVSSGSALVLSGAGNDATNFEPAHDIGIYVTGWGSIDIEGAPDGGASQLIANGVSIHQAESESPYPNTIRAINCQTGFAGASGRFAPGVLVYAGSSLTLRNSSLVGNQGAGVQVLPGTSGTPASTYTGAIDLGTASSAGRNTITGNCGANLWVGLIPSAPIAAEGNVFSAGDCLSASPALPDGVPLCILGLNPSDTQYDVGVPAVDGGLARDAVNVAHCTLQ